MMNARRRFPTRSARRSSSRASLVRLRPPSLRSVELNSNSYLFVGAHKSIAAVIPPRVATRRSSASRVCDCAVMASRSALVHTHSLPRYARSCSVALRAPLYTHALRACRTPAPSPLSRMYVLCAPGGAARKGLANARPAGQSSFPSSSSFPPFPSFLLRIVLIALRARHHGVPRFARSVLMCRSSAAAPPRRSSSLPSSTCRDSGRSRGQPPSPPPPPLLPPPPSSLLLPRRTCDALRATPLLLRVTVRLRRRRRDRSRIPRRREAPSRRGGVLASNALEWSESMYARV